MNAIATQPNPFAPATSGESSQLAKHSDITGSAREIAEVQSAIAVAKRFPRDQKTSYDRIMLACQRPTLAAGALYTYARGGSDVTGPSIRLAEAIAREWGNMQCGIRELEQRNGESTVEAFAWDMETNTKVSKVFQVAHIRHTRQGVKRLEDPRDIYEMVANQGARRLRACILGIIPGDVIEAATAECERTLTSTADTSPEAIKRIVERFELFGVGKEQIELRIQRRLEAITPAQVVNLRKIYTSLTDGMSTPSEWFEFETPEEAGKAADRASELARKFAEKRAKQTQSADTSNVVTPDVGPQSSPDDNEHPAEQSDTKPTNDAPVTIDVLGPAFPEITI